MKARAKAHRAKHGPEFRGVVKKVAGKLTNRPDLVSEGRAEMVRWVIPDSQETRFP